MYQSLINQQKQSLGYLVQPKASATSISQMRTRAIAELGSDVPEGYVNFLELSDGLHWSGLHVHSSKTLPIAGFKDRFIQGFVEANLDHRDIDECKELLIFAEGNIDLYVYSLPQGNFFILDRISLDVTEEADSFDGTCQAILQIFGVDGGIG